MDAPARRIVLGTTILLASHACTALAADATIVWHGSTDIAIGRGERGPWQQNDSRFDYVDDPAVAIDLAVDRAGIVHLVTAG